MKSFKFGLRTYAAFDGWKKKSLVCNCEFRKLKAFKKFINFETTSKTHWNEWQLMSTGTKTKANFYFPRRKKHDGAISEYILLLKLIDNMQNVWADK